MGLFGDIAGGAVGIGASIYGGIAASNAMKKVRKNLEQQREDNKDWFDRRYNEDGTERADAQSALTKAREEFRTRNRQSQGTQAVAGGTEESVAATKAANAKGMSDTVSNIDKSAEARKDNIEQQYMSTDRSIQNQLNDLEQKKAANTAQAVQGAGSILSGFLGGL